MAGLNKFDDKDKRAQRRRNHVARDLYKGKKNVKPKRTDDDDDEDGDEDNDEALMELRSVIARVVTEFDVSFAPGEDGTALLEDSLDTFTIALAPLMLVFTKRKV